MTGPLPEDSAERKTYPMHAVIAGYFPAALAKVSRHSFDGNEKHNPGESLHWARGKSDDHLDAAMRHMVEGDLTGAAWRILAALQLECEAKGAPVAPLARKVGKGGGDSGYTYVITTLPPRFVPYDAHYPGGQAYEDYIREYGSYAVTGRPLEHPATNTGD